MSDRPVRVALYARYSSDRQSETSIEDQFRVCREEAHRQDWQIVAEEADHAVSGTVLLRPGLQRILDLGRRREVDLVLAEALDRLSRSQADIAGIFEQLSFRGVRIITLSEGVISEIHVGIGGTMSALYLKQLAEKTHRGLRGRVEAGRSGGGRAFGYRAVPGPDGKPGVLEILPEEAAVVRRIFQEYIADNSPRAIAKAYNRAAIPAPGSKGWTASTIIGNRKRGTGILNNRMYVGERIWNRLSYRRNPDTRKRVSRLNPREEWIVTEVPELRIIDDDLWNRVQVLQDSRARPTRPDSTKGPDWRHRRPKHLLSGLIKCGVCGGGMTLISRIYYGCAANRNKGTCDNRLTLRLDRLEEAVLRGLQAHLLTPELTERFVREYACEMNRLRAEEDAVHADAHRRIQIVDRRIGNIVEAVADGRSSPVLLDKLAELEKEKAGLEDARQAPRPNPVRIHPNAASIYADKIANLRDALNAPDTREQAATILRTLIEKIRLHPVDDALRIELIGELATLLAFAQDEDSSKTKPGSNAKPGRTKWLVAGARNQRYLHLDYAACRLN